jgi:hypothetical protein
MKRALAALRIVNRCACEPPSAEYLQAAEYHAQLGRAGGAVARAVGVCKRACLLAANWSVCEARTGACVRACLCVCSCCVVGTSS